MRTLGAREVERIQPLVDELSQTCHDSGRCGYDQASAVCSVFLEVMAGGLRKNEPSAYDCLRSLIKDLTKLAETTPENVDAVLDFMQTVVVETPQH